MQAAQRKNEWKFRSLLSFSGRIAALLIIAAVAVVLIAPDYDLADSTCGQIGTMHLVPAPTAGVVMVSSSGPERNTALLAMAEPTALASGPPSHKRTCTWLC